MYNVRFLNILFHSTSLLSPTVASHYRLQFLTLQNSSQYLVSISDHILNVYTLLTAPHCHHFPFLTLHCVSKKVPPFISMITWSNVDQS